MSRRLTIDGVEIHDGADCYVIAEIGHNHQGSVEQAKAMFTVVKDCGANAVKLQKRSNRTLYTRAFFEQPYVLVEPVVASKYPPGHALMLIPGALVGFPALMSLVLTGVTAALLFGLATRVYNVWIGVLSWATWITAPIVLRFHPSYFSELTTTAVLLGAWWSLLSWRETRRARWLMLVAASSRPGESSR